MNGVGAAPAAAADLERERSSAPRRTETRRPE